MRNGYKRSKYKRHYVFFAFLTLVFLIYANPLKGQTITENSALTFGKVVLVDNNAVRRIEMLPGGGYNADLQYIFFTEPQRANITVSGYAPTTVLNVSISSPTLNKPGGGPAFFSISDVFTNPAIIETDSSGSATFEVGATLSSNGTGASFTNNKYEGNYTVTVTP